MALSALDPDTADPNTVLPIVDLQNGIIGTAREIIDLLSTRSA
jgi:hypothetical protein